MVHVGMNAEQTQTCHHDPHSRILSPAHVAYTWDNLAGRLVRLPGSKQMFIPLFLRASLFNCNLFPPCRLCCLLLVVALTTYQDGFCLDFFVVGFLFSFFNIDDIH